MVDIPAEKEVLPNAFEPDVDHSEDGPVAVANVRWTADMDSLPDTGGKTPG